MGADCSYLELLSGGKVNRIDEEAMDLPALRVAMAANGPVWAEVVAGDLDPDRVIIRRRDDGSESHAPLGIRLAQVMDGDHRDWGLERLKIRHDVRNARLTEVEHQDVGVGGFEDVCLTCGGLQGECDAHTQTLQAFDNLFPKLPIGDNDAGANHAVLPSAPLPAVSRLRGRRMVNVVPSSATDRNDNEPSR